MLAITYSMKKEIKVAKWGTPKKYFIDNINHDNINHDNINHDNINHDNINHDNIKRGRLHQKIRTLCLFIHFVNVLCI
jgi:hypothetical protein